MATSWTGRPLSPLLLDLIRSPETGARLKQDGDALVATGERFPVAQGFPVFIPGAIGKGQTSPAETQIIDAFALRGRSYFDDNYGRLAADGSDRRQRQAVVSRLLETTIKPGHLVLEAGAGPAVLGEEVQRLGGRHVAVDLSHQNLLAGRDRVGELDGIVANLVNLPLASGRFDLVTAIGCLEYVPQMRRAINELVRVSAIGAPLIASFANRNSPRRWWDELLVIPVSRVKRRAGGGDDSGYGRSLVTESAVASMMARSGAKPCQVHWLNGGFLGYPLSEMSRIRTFERWLHTQGEFFRKAASEFVVVARRVR